MPPQQAKHEEWCTVVLLVQLNLWPQLASCQAPGPTQANSVWGRKEGLGPIPQIKGVYSPSGNGRGDGSQMELTQGSERMIPSLSMQQVSDPVPLGVGPHMNILGISCPVHCNDLQAEIS